MSYKRSRNDFEADRSSSQPQPPFVFYGTPLPPLDTETRDDGTYVPVWKQEVRDERGRKRLHGAFTGGFSAGYFNTVGSKEGWIPSTFVSSRTNRQNAGDKQAEQRAEDFMDEEDLADQEESQKLQTQAGFAGLGSTQDDGGRRDFVSELFHDPHDTMGVKLLQRMGWRPGQGLGAKVKRKPRGDEGVSDDTDSERLFAPDDVPMITFDKKIDKFGLGWAGEKRLGAATTASKFSRSKILAGNDSEDEPDSFQVRKPAQKKSKQKKTGFGVGVLNDNGSDDEDPYENGPKISYNKIIGGDRKKKKGGIIANSTGSSTVSKPVFFSQKLTSQTRNNNFRKCHDGRLPLDGFILAAQSLTLDNNAVSKGDINGVLNNLKQVKPTATPSSPQQAASTYAKIVQTDKPSNIYQYSALLQANGLLSGTLSSLINGIGGQATAQNSASNSNPDPPTPVYPKKLSCDAPYTVSESALRSAIYIPPTFTKGQKPPVILFPGTGNTGFQTFSGNFIKLLSGQSWADPVWVNVPKSLLDDAQINAQYAAYALNYIASLTGKNTTMVAWSQGNINSQWAYKYWPSTRKTTSDHIAISADYAGTVFANFICPDGLALCAPSVYQQQYLGDSNYITALRSNDGDSGYVPTTSIFSGLFDEVVQPQSGTGASAFLKDARSVGVTNNEVQKVCAGKGLAATFYTHEGVLVNPLSLALLKDAMSHEGPGQVSRLDLNSVCAGYLAPGLGLGDLLLTGNAVAIAGLGILVGQPKTNVEPALQAFANSAPGTCAA